MRAYRFFLASSIMIPERERFENLDGIRFFGALIVFLFHCVTLHREIWGDFFESNTLLQPIIKALSLGHLGVNLFFVLSGFLLTSLMLQEIDRNGKINVVHFLMRRTLRLWPLYFVIVLFGFFLFPHLPYGFETVHELWRYLVFFSNIDEIIVGMHDRINFLTATWSISVEEQFYLGWAVLLLIFTFRKRISFVVFFTLIMLGTLIFRIIYQHDERTIYFHTFSVISDFAVGGFGALLAHSSRLTPYIASWKKGLQAIIYIGIIGVVVASEKLLTGNVLFIQRFVIASAFLLFILIQVSSNSVFLPFDRFKFLREAGKRTYGFYLFHCIALFYCSELFKQFGWTESIWYFLLFIACAFGLTTTLAFLSYRYFEEPILKLKRHFS